MNKFETFIFKNGKALDLYTVDGGKPKSSADIFVNSKQAREIIGAEKRAYNKWLADNRTGNNLFPVQNRGKLTVNVINYFTFIKTCFNLYKGDGEAIAQELTDALAVYMTDANQEED